MYRIGFAKDIHKLVKNRRLMLGGIHIPYAYGEEAHSDGDVLIHSLAEALLGSLALGDLGKFYPPNDKKYQDISSLIILKDVLNKIAKHKYEIVNIDISIVLEKPKLMKYINKIRLNLSKVMNLDINNISVKANTNEGIDEVGHNKAIMCYTIVLVKNKL